MLWSLLMLLNAGALPPTAVRGETGMVVCVAPTAADIGLSILKQGGNAVDASVAVAFAEAVSWPEAGNIGGGGFMLVWPGNGQPPKLIDYREMAPAPATEAMFAKTINYQSVQVTGVPGTVGGLELAHKTYGKLPWKTLVQPAIALAKDGVTVNAALASSLNSVTNPNMTFNKEFLRLFRKPDGKPWKSGDVLKQPDLAATLQIIADQGADSFYQGALAKKFAQAMRESDGLITEADLGNYRAIIRDPICTSYRGYDVYAPPPPSSGGVTLGLMLNILESFDLKSHPRHSAWTTHHIAEAMRRAYADRAEYLGDPEFSSYPKKLLSQEYADKLAATIEPEKATPSTTLKPKMLLREGGSDTTHFSVVDGNGMAVSNTYTIENAFGNRVVLPGLGFILNNEMTDFNHRPGVTDQLGNIGSKPNLVAPGKRMLSSMCPTIVTRDGKLVLVTGSPGGRTIINTVACVIINVIDYGMSLADAVAAPRMHQQWFPDRIQHEPFPKFDQLKQSLTKYGHRVEASIQGDAHSIMIDPKTGERIGVADKRRDGKAAGY